MKKELDKMTMQELDEEIGLFILPEDVFLVLDEEYQEEYISLYENDNTIIEPEDLVEYLYRRSDNIDKEKALLIILKNNISVKNKMTLDENQAYLYKKIIEKLQSCLSEKRISIYKHVMNSETHKVDGIEEISSEELCAYPILNEYSTEREKQNQKKREEKYEKFLARKEKKRRINLDRIKKLGEEVDFDTVLKVIQLDDMPDIFTDGPELGFLIRWMISKNSLIDSGIDHKKIENIDEEKGLENFLREQPPEYFFDEFKIRLDEFMNYLDIDRLLLTSVYRYAQILENNILEPETVKEIQAYFKIVLRHIENKNTRLNLVMEDVETKKRTEIKFSEKEIKKILSKFIGDGVYLGERLIKNTKEELLDNEKKLSDIDPLILQELVFEQEDFVTLINNRTENFIYIMENSNIDSSHVKILIKELSKLETEVIDKLVEKKLLTLEDVIEVYKEGKIGKKQLLELGNKEIIDDQTIVKIYYKQKEEKFDEELVLSKNELLEYFNLDRIKKYIENNELEEEFFEFYKEILPENEFEKETILNQINELLVEYNDKDLNKKFYIAGLIRTKDIEGKISENDIISMFENEQIDFDKILEIYNLDLISESSVNLLIDFYNLSETVIEKLDLNYVSVENVSHLELSLKENYIYDRYMQQEYGFNTEGPAIIGLINENLNIEQLSELYSLGKVKEEDLYEYAKKGLFDQKIIRDLYINSLISDAILEDLFERKLISEKSKEFAKKTRNMGQLSKNIDKKLGMHIYDDGIEIDDTVILPLEKKGEKVERIVDIGGDGTTKLPKLKKVIDPGIRDEKIRSLGAKKIKRDCVEYDEKSPFNDYEFYIIPLETGEINPDCIVIAERYYEDKFDYEEKLIDGNATYLFKLGDLTRISKKSKPEIIFLMQEQKDKTMTRLSHTKYWAKNLDEAVENISGKKMKSKYTPEELKKINKINELVDGFEDYTNNNEYTRPFDIFYY